MIPVSENKHYHFKCLGFLFSSVRFHTIKVKKENSIDAFVVHI
ncbi:MAG: hypothetical protein ACJA0E_002217 [Bermanella sp.]|jgi:hypothetical protein